MPIVVPKIAQIAIRREALHRKDEAGHLRMEVSIAGHHLIVCSWLVEDIYGGEKYRCNCGFRTNSQHVSNPRWKGTEYDAKLDAKHAVMLLLGIQEACLQKTATYEEYQYFKAVALEALFGK